MEGIFNSDSGSDSDFDGFDFYDIIQSERRVQTFRDDDDGSDFDFGHDDGDTSSDDSDGDTTGVGNVEWKMNGFGDVVPKDFCGPPPGPTCVFDSGDGKPIEYLHLILPSDFFNLWSQQTNLYAKQQQDKIGAVDKYWKDTSPEEMKAFLGVNIIMAISPQPTIASYWSEDNFIGNQGIKDIMTKNRFEKITQYMHIADNTVQPPRDSANYDPVFKARPIIELVKLTSRRSMNPGRFLSIDEMMIGFKGRVAFRQYMPAKPTKWGVKVWAIADPGSGYTYDFNVYTGKTNAGPPNPNGLGYQVVMDLSKPYLDKRHEVVYDNFFSSVTLSVDLLKRETYSTATTRVNRKQFPPQLKKLKLKKGETRSAQADLGDGRKLTAISWQDKKQVNILTTAESNDMTTVERRVGHERKNVEIPKAVLRYNNGMGGVDLADQRRSYYPIGRESKKWWRYIFWFCVNTAMINAYLLFKRSNLPATKERATMDMWVFYHKVAQSLTANFSSRKTPAKRLRRDSVQLHTIGTLEKRKRECVVCKKRGRRTPKGRARETKQLCVKCDLPMCKPCFVEYHEEYSYSFNADE